MCLAVPGRLTEILGEGELRMGRVDFERRRAAGLPGLPPRGPRRRLRPRPRRLRHLAHRRGGRPARRCGRWPRSASRRCRRSRARCGTLTSTAIPRPCDARLADIRAAWPPALDAHGGLRRPDALDPEVRPRRSCCPRTSRLVHGPGCPVCVTRPRADRPRGGDRLPTRRDLLLVRRHAPRARARSDDLLTVKAAGGDVRIVYSPLDAVRLARQHPDRKVVFFAVGFETTAPANAMAVHRAAAEGLDNFSVLVAHVLVPPALEALLSEPDVTGAGPARPRPRLRRDRLSRLRGPRPPPPRPHRGHGLRAARHPARRAGGRAPSSSAARRRRRERVPAGGARGRQPRGPAHDRQRSSWSPTAPGVGLGVIPQSGYALAPRYARFDAEHVFDVEGVTAVEPEECRAGLVLQGRLRPTECPEFGARCNPEHPAGRHHGLRRGGLCGLLPLRPGRPRRGEHGAGHRSPCSPVPLPSTIRDIVQLAHGGGGSKTARLIETVMLPAFQQPGPGRPRRRRAHPRRPGATSPSRRTRSWSSPSSSRAETSAPWPSTAPRTTSPCAGRSRSPSAPASSSRKASPWRTSIVSSPPWPWPRPPSGRPLVTGDTKVVDKGKGDGIFINTSGVGRVRPGVRVGPQRACPGDAILVSGPIGDHGIAVMAAREGIDFETALLSDSAPVADLVRALARFGTRRARPARPDARRAGHRARGDRQRLRRRHPPRRVHDPRAPGGARRLRAARVRPAVRRLRGPLPGHRARRAGTRRPGRRPVAARPAATRASSAP